VNSGSYFFVVLQPGSDPLVGQTIDGRFEIRDRLGKGGMGTVYRAWQRSVDREVAIKLMDPAYSRDQTAVRRFEREAQLASRLSQPNTVSVFDFGKAADGRLFIAMELIRVRTLHNILITEGTFSVNRAARVGIQICDALEAAHKLGIVHRDLKLDNVMVLDDPPGRDLVKVLDFGLAKQLGDVDVKGTGHGIVVGTPRYIAPEAAVGGAMSPAADLYALGVMLAELVTGRPLWDSDSLADLLAHKLAPRAAVVRVPPELHGLVVDLIDPKPELRPSPAATRERLAQNEPASAVHKQVHAPPAGRAHDDVVDIATTQRDAPPPRSGRTQRWGTIGLVLVGVIAAGLIALGVVGPRSTPAAHSDAAAVAATTDARPPDAAAPDPWALHDGRDPDQIVLHVVSDPPGASIRLGAGERGIAPLDVFAPLADATVPLTATWGGKIIAVVSVSLDRDQTITIEQPKSQPK